MHENVIFYTFSTPFELIIKGNLLKISLISEYKDSRSGYKKESCNSIVDYSSLCYTYLLLT